MPNQSNDVKKERLRYLNDNNIIEHWINYRHICFDSRRNSNYYSFIYMLYNCRIIPDDFDISTDDVEIIDRWYMAYLKRNNTLKRRIERIITNFEKPVFATLTFTNDVLKNTSSETRRRYVSRYLKSQGCLYVANIDFGKDKGREHYHAVVSQPLDPKSYKLGHIDFIAITNKDPLRLAKYVNKLTKHALKDTACKGERIIYSRGLKLHRTTGYHRFTEDDRLWLRREIARMFKI